MCLIFQGTYPAKVTVLDFAAAGIPKDPYSSGVVDQSLGIGMSPAHGRAKMTSSSLYTSRSESSGSISRGS